jgi:hypothetical protein
MRKKVNASTSDSDTNTNNSERCDGGHHQVEQIGDENEFRDTEFEDLVLLERPQQILQLILQERVDGFMEEKIIDTNINRYVPPKDSHGYRTLCSNKTVAPRGCNNAALVGCKLHELFHKICVSTMSNL